MRPNPWEVLAVIAVAVLLASAAFLVLDLNARHP